MAALDFLPATTYKAPKLEQAQARSHILNTIIEDDEESTRGLPTAKSATDEMSSRLANWKSPLSENFPTPRANLFTPLSDHFPTPRGKHFMVAPYLPASPTASDSTASSGPFSAPATRDSFGTQATQFDDLYDVSSDEEEYRRKSARNRASARLSTASGRSAASRSSLPSLIIPQSNDSWGSESLKMLTSPVPPTPPPKIPMSPAIFRYLASQEVPSSSAPPSLDGSMTSEQMAQMSAPPTPDVGNDTSEDGWGGVQLQPSAMAILRSLSLDDVEDVVAEQVIEVPQMDPAVEMQQSPPPIHSNIRRHHSVVLSPEQQRCFGDLTALEIPSPGGFFSASSPSTRHTWHIAPLDKNIDAPPSSATADNYYKTPWSSVPISSIPEVSETGSVVDSQRPKLVDRDSDETIMPSETDDAEIVATELLDQDAGYICKLEIVAQENINWTFRWLTAQTSYLADLINPSEARDDEIAIQRRATILKKSVEQDVVPEFLSKGTVRFSEIPTAKNATGIVGCPAPKLGRQESAYYRSFSQLLRQSEPHDVFVHRIPRFEALQSQRVNFPELHRNQLLAKYQLSVVPMSPKKRMSANVARGDELTMEDPAKIRSDKDREAKEHLRVANWSITAAKMLNGGRLIAAPVAKRLARLSLFEASANGAPRDRARVLDLGGQATCDWAWQCALEYPNMKVYTVTTKSTLQYSNSNIRGPGNHRQVAVEKLTKLPFKDNQFDLISARQLHSILKILSENGQDEYEACLRECMRCLKPGGYLEFSILDADIVNAGPLGQAKSVEFGFSLKTRGYDAAPTKAWLTRLRKTGFVETKRAWLYLPMGAPLISKPESRDSMGKEVNLELEAMVLGSTQAVASVTGVMASWAWEKWMLKLQMESGFAEKSLLDGVYDIVEEGRMCGAGWRMLNGWTRKPLRKR